MASGYTSTQKAQALILLAANRGKVNLTASQTGISTDTIAKWAAQERTAPDTDLGAGMEMAIHYLMGQIPHLVNKYNIAELLDTLLDKWLIYQGIPQQNVQMILSVLATKSVPELDNLLGEIETGQALQIEASRGEIIEVPGTTEKAPSVLDLIQYRSTPEETVDGEAPNDGLPETNDW